MDRKGNVIPFSPWLQVVPLLVKALSLEQVEGAPVVVDHSGRAYLLVRLLGGLSLTQLHTIVETLPRSGQAAWDEVVRRWPALAEEIVASAPT